MTQMSYVYGHPDPELVTLSAGAIQCSPLAPGAARLEDAAAASARDIVVQAPAGTVERRAVLALALRALAPGGRLTCLALKDRGGSRLAGDLRDLGCGFSEEARRHHRICTVTGGGDNAAVDAAIAAGAARADARLGFWTQPGIFSWDRIDPGTALLIERLPQLAGRGADFGCGLGIIARAVLASPKVMHLDLVDLDRRAVDMAGRNVTDPRAAFHWADVRAWKPQAILDFVVMNPPFHHAGGEDRGLGQAFVGRAAALLRGGGACWITANRHLPYEAVLGSAFRRWEAVADSGGYKIIQAIK